MYKVVTELRGEGKSQRRVTAVHVIDVLYLGGEDLRRLHFMERQKQAALFLRVVNKSSRSDLVRMRMKAVFKLEVLFFYSFLSVLWIGTVMMPIQILIRLSILMLIWVPP